MQPDRLALLPQTRLTLSRRSLLAGAAVLATTARHTSAQTPVATPVAADAFLERIAPLFAMTPAELVEMTEDSFAPFTYADLASQLASVGLPTPNRDTLPEGFLPGTQALPLSHNAFQFALTPAWADTFGFWPLEIDRVLVAGEPPNMVALFAGIDTERVRAALMASGYRVVLQEIGGEYYSFGDDFSPTTEVGRLGVGSMNQAVVRDGTAVFTRDEGTIQRVTQVMAGLAPSILEVGGWSDLMTTLAGDTVGLVAAGPSAFARSGDASAILQLTFSVRAGATNPDPEADPDPTEATTIAELPETSARVQVRIRYADAATAAEEAEAIPERWESMESAANEPFTDLMLVESAGVAPGDPTVAAIDFRVKGPAGWWYQLLYRSDLGPFVPQG
jgi:hypothetical protein